MAHLPWLPSIRITNLTLTPSVPGQIRHEIPTTGAVKVFNTGAGRWTGTIQFGRVDSADLGLRVEAFIAGLNGSQHTTDIPLARIKNLATADATLETAQIGRYYNYNNRLIVVHGRDSNGTLIFPELPINQNEVLTSPNRLRIRLRETQASMPQTPDSWGPWALSFTEALQ